MGCKTMLGVNISGWQERVDYHKLKACGIDIVYIRSSVGSEHIDPLLQQHYRGCKENGLKVGFFHYLTARNKAEALAEARFYASAISNTAPDCLPALQFEYIDGLSRDEINDIAQQFLTLTERLTRIRPMLLSDAYKASLVLQPHLTKYPLWISQPGAAQPSREIIWPCWTGFLYYKKALLPGLQGMVALSKFTPAALLPGHTTLPRQSVCRYYTVRSGDMLWLIAAKFGTTTAELMRLNRLRDSKDIKIGRILKIPPHAYLKEKSYRVQCGDTIGRVADKNFTTVGRLLGINQLHSNDPLIPGSLLYY